MSRHDGIHGFWFKNVASIQETLGFEMKRSLQGTTPKNYRPITCLPMMWKVLRARIREEISYSLTSHGLLPKEQKRCRKGPRGTEKIVHLEQHILNEIKTRWIKSSYGLH